MPRVKNEIPPKGPYTMGQVAKLLDIDKSTLYRWERKGKIPKVQRVNRNGERSYSDELVAQIRNIRDEDLKLVDADAWKEAREARATDKDHE